MKKTGKYEEIKKTRKYEEIKKTRKYEENKWKEKEGIGDEKKSKIEGMNISADM